MSAPIESLYGQKGVFVYVCSYLNNNDINSFLRTCKKFNNFGKQSNAIQQFICCNLGVYSRFTDCNWIETSQRLKKITSGDWKLELVVNTQGIPQPSIIPKVGHILIGDGILQAHPSYFKCFESTTCAFFASSLREKQINPGLSILHYKLDENKRPTSKLGTLVRDVDQFGRTLGLCTLCLDLVAVVNERKIAENASEKCLLFWNLRNYKLLCYKKLDIELGFNGKIDGIVWHEMKLYVWWQKKVFENQYQQCCTSLSFL